MADFNMIQKQREILREFRQANPQRAQAEADAEKQHKKEVAGAETFLQDKKNVANNAQTKVDKSIAYTKGSLGKVNLEYLYNESKFTEPSGNPEGDPEAELNKSVAAIEKASQDIESSVWNLEWWRQERAKRRQLLVRLAVVALVIFAVAAFFAYRAWQRNNDLEARYERATKALADRQWQDTRNEISSLIAIEPNFKDAPTLFRESYYRPAVQALQKQNWEEARSQLNALINVDGNYRDSQILLRESYYRPIVNALKAKEWVKARENLTSLLALDGTYKDVQTLVKDSYYLEAVDAISKKNWDNAASSLATLQEIDANYKDVPSLKATYPELAQALSAHSQTPSLTWQAIDGQWTQDKDVIVSVTPGDRGWREGRYIAGPNATWKDYTFSGQIKFHNTNNDEITILFRVRDAQAESPGEQDQGHYYQFVLYGRSGSIWLWRIANGGSSLTNVRFSFNTDQWYQFRVELRGSSAKLYLDDQLVLQYDRLTEYQSGGVGVKTYGRTIGYFKDLTLRLQ